MRNCCQLSAHSVCPLAVPVPFVFLWIIENWSEKGLMVVPNELTTRISPASRKFVHARPLSSPLSLIQFQKRFTIVWAEDEDFLSVPPMAPEFSGPPFNSIQYRCIFAVNSPAVTGSHIRPHILPPHSYCHCCLPIAATKRSGGIRIFGIATVNTENYLFNRWFPWTLTSAAQWYIPVNQRKFTEERETY